MTGLTKFICNHDELTLQDPVVKIRGQCKTVSASLYNGVELNPQVILTFYLHLKHHLWFLTWHAGPNLESHFSFVM